MRYGPFYPSLIVSEPYGRTPWTNPGPVLRRPNGVDAVVTIPSDAASDFLRVTGFDANIPPGKTITEVQLELPSMQQGGNLFNNSDQLIVGPLGDQQAWVAMPFIRVESDSTPGLTPGVVNESKFGFKFAVYNGGGRAAFVVESLAMYVEAD